MLKVLGIGNALVDVMTILKDDSILGKFSLPKGSMQLVDNRKSEWIKSETISLKTTLASGGSAANTIHGLAKLGVETAYIGSIGKDETGNFFENDMKNAGIRTLLSRRNSPTGTAIAFISADSERTFATHLGAAVELGPDDLRPEYFKDYDILYIEGYAIYNMPLIEKACRIARDQKMKVVIDLASYNVVEASLEDFRLIIGNYANIVFANEEEAKAYTGKGPEEALEVISRECDIAVIKAGSEGSWIQRGSEIIKIGTPEVNLLDTTGAGDLYAAGFLYGYSSECNLEVCGQYGSLVAGKVIEILGARMDDRKWSEIKKMLREIE